MTREDFINRINEDFANNPERWVASGSRNTLGMELSAPHLSIWVTIQTLNDVAEQEDLYFISDRRIDQFLVVNRDTIPKIAAKLDHACKKAEQDFLASMKQVWQG